MRSLLLAASVVLITATPALSQNNDLEGRVDRMEREVRALQRQVFPGGDPEFFEPEIRSGSREGLAGNPATSPITDLTDRVNSLERQLATLTGQVEENSFELRQLRARIEALQGGSETPPEGEENDDTVEAAPASEPPEATPAPSSDTASSEQPLPDDPGEASYVRGYRMWRDGQYAEAREQLQATVENYPGHQIESRARNLLGRAYLDDDKPANATEIFVRNYQELPDGERAADSLFFLGVALTELNYNDRACLAFDELDEVYGDSVRGPIRRQVPTARSAAGCSE